jgi:hypothetical protein
MRSTDTLADAIFDLGTVTGHILQHMSRWAAHVSPNAPDRDEAWRTILSGVLEPVLDRHPPERIDAACRLLAEACDAIESEVLLVPPPEVSETRLRRPRPPRRPG